MSGKLIPKRPIGILTPSQGAIASMKENQKQQEYNQIKTLTPYIYWTLNLCNTYPIQESQTASAATFFSDIQTMFECPPFDIVLSHDPYENHTHCTLCSRASNVDLLFDMNIIECPDHGLPKLIDCKPGTLAIIIHKWQSELCNTYITYVDDKPFTSSLSDIRSILTDIPQVITGRGDYPISNSSGYCQASMVHNLRKSIK